MSEAAPATVVITDANILINLLVVGRLSLLGSIPGHVFVVPDQVVAEVTDVDQRAQLAHGVSEQWLGVESLTDMGALTLYAELRTVMGPGEAACLALAVQNGWQIASDERKRFRREALDRLGEARLLTTPDLYVLAIRARLLTVAEADADKAILAANRFVMKFGSFGELLHP